ncbi:Utp25/U3 small nucleolar RNA-associated SSU processome protein 25 [Phytophthora infestans]|uniref:Utp25/U3 small nucleolar RNA-associated SSU processome protein 25 n=1 Tax=Phytophthora infestans TaxID=4787 RepID=A0A833THC9_PHYIN|nr:Utp25/U3 small nucleolar RNA-associated SSU processome protein 25 [Phytophthora infestans]
MGPRKGGGKKKGSRKRKANVWDDAEPKAKGGAVSSGNEGKPRKTGSMMGQWKSQKIAERTKTRKFFSNVGEKKTMQREQYEKTWDRTANAIYKKDSEEVGQEAEVEEDESQSEDSDSDDENVLNKKNSIFAEFVNTFRTSEPVEEEDDDGDEEEEFEEVLVDENGQEIEEDDDEENETAEEIIDDVKEDEEQVASMEKDDEEQLDEKEEDEHEDPYRRRYLLSSFTEQDAKIINAQTKKFARVSIPTLQDDAYDVTYRAGAEEVRGLDGVVTTPECAAKQKPYVRSRLLATWKQRGLDAETVFPKGSVEYTLSQQMAVYTDVYFAGQTYENTAKLRQLSAMHVLNHVLKARDTVTRNNERIKKQSDEEKEYRDQGLCRASVLVLLPLRSSAVAFVDQLLQLLPSNVDTYHNKDRFVSEFSSIPDDDEPSNDDKKEWQRVFEQGNNDDCFQLGISLSRKAVRFYSEYHHADIILASPLGLRQQLGDEVAELVDAQTSDDVKLSSDFLSTIEVCIVDSASLMAMQNLEHLRTVLRATNLQPKEAPNADFSRVREWNLAFLASYFRQTIVFAHGAEPALNALVNKTCRNISGVVKYTRRYDAADGSASISRVVPQVKQIFQRVDLEHSGRLTAAHEVEIRFAYFKKHVFDPLLDHPRKHVLIFIPSYFDYVRVRNLFNDTMNKKLIRSVQCCEYTTSKQVSRARTSFYHGHCHVMLYTERFHFYHQYQIRGVHQLIWYGLPVMGDFYAEMMNMLQSSDSAGQSDDGLADSTDGKSSIALFTRLDLLRMQRIVGNKRAERMCQAKAAKPTFLFC